jgi:hypothetical protein
MQVSVEGVPLLMVQLGAATQYRTQALLSVFIFCALPIDFVRAL